MGAVHPGLSSIDLKGHKVMKVSTIIISARYIDLCSSLIIKQLLERKKEREER